MVVNYKDQQTPAVRIWDGSKATDIAGVEVIEAYPQTQSRISSHAGESAKVYADSRVVMPARVRVRIGIQNSVADLNEGALAFLTDASHTTENADAMRFAVTTLYTKYFNMAVVQTHERNTPEMLGVRVFDVTFEECLIYFKANGDMTINDVANPEDAKSSQSAVQIAS